jgi:hypothetical protein
LYDHFNGRDVIDRCDSLADGIFFGWEKADTFIDNTGHSTSQIITEFITTLA